MDKPVRRFISKFRRGTDTRVGEIDVTSIPLATLQAIFNEPPEEQMYWSYDVEERHAHALQPFVSEPLDLGANEYFLESASM